jgi:hypothetical protein
VTAVIAPPVEETDRNLAGGGDDTSRSVAWAATVEPIVELLFAEARRRRRRIRLTVLTVVALAVAATALGLAWSRGPAGRGASQAPAVRVGQSQPATVSRLAWVGFDGALVLGNLTTFTARTITQINADPVAPLVPFDGRLYWINQSGGQVDGADWPSTIEALNLTTDTSTDIGPGEFSFPAPDGRHLYISLTDTTLAELQAGAVSQARQLTLPDGWYLPGGFSVAVANGIVVQSNDAKSLSHPPVLAVWSPRSGRVQVIGRAVGNAVANVIGAYTPPRAGYSLLAWMPAGCQLYRCPITITNTATGSSLKLRSPLRRGFVLGGAFSPDGRQLAVFVNRGQQAGGGTAELAIASTATGAMRLVPSVRLAVGADDDWLRWLPDGARLVVLANHDYLVAASTLEVQPFHFTGRVQAVNFSAELLPRG